MAAYSASSENTEEFDEWFSPEEEEEFLFLNLRQSLLNIPQHSSLWGVLSTGNPVVVIELLLTLFPLEEENYMREREWHAQGSTLEHFFLTNFKIE